MDIEIRSVIHYFFLRKYCAASTAAMIDSAYGAGTITPNGVRYWYKQFESGRTDLEDAYRSGRPCLNIDPNVVRSILEDYPFASARYIAEKVNVSCGKIISMLKLELGLTKKHSRWVPHFLSPEQKSLRVECSRELLVTLKKLKTTQRAAVITCDESWIYLNYPHETKWCAINERPPDIEKRMIQTEKLMFFCAFSCYGIVSIDVLPNHATFNSTYVCNTILPNLKERVCAHIKNKTTHRLILHMDNAKPHNAKKTMEKIKELGFNRLKHPPYSPDISPCDFFLFGYVKSQLRNYDVKSSYELSKAVREICEKIDINIWQSVYESWLKRLEAVIACGGDYPYIY